MSLRFRLNLLITLVFLFTLLAGAALTIHNARKALAEETESTAKLTLQLLELAFLQVNPESKFIRSSMLMRQIKQFGKARHLHIEIIHGKDVEPFDQAQLDIYKPDAPEWFVKLVEPTSMVLRRSILIPGLPSSELIIRPDPSSEITEAWEEARSFLGLLLAFFIIANVLVYLIIGRLLKPVNTIIEGLDAIEQGNYMTRLPHLKLPELNKISQKFNHMASVLEESHEQNRYLKQKTQAIQEEERRHLARELHDEMGQSISAIKAVAVSIRQSSKDEKTINCASTIADISSHIYGVVRGMMQRLHPVILDELGLIPALNDLIDNWNTYHEETFCHFKVDDGFRELSQELAITAYRVVQECLTNVAKHANAENVWITLSKKADNLQLTIEDDGCGFDPGRSTTGLGLPGMRERVEALKGRYHQSGGPGKGTRIEVLLPLNTQKDSRSE